MEPPAGRPPTTPTAQTPGPPATGSPPQPAGKGKTLIVVIGVLVVLVVIGKVVADKEMNPPVRTSSGSSRPAAEPGAGSSTTTYNIGQSFSLGSFSYTIMQPEVRTSVGEGITTYRPSAGAVYVIVEYTERNNGNESATVGGSPMTLRDAQGRIFDSDSEAQAGLWMSGRTRPAPTLQPGIDNRAATGFQVPEAAAHGPITFVVRERRYGPGRAEVQATLP